MFTDTNLFFVYLLLFKQYFGEYILQHETGAVWKKKGNLSLKGTFYGLFLKISPLKDWIIDKLRCCILTTLTIQTWDLSIQIMFDMIFSISPTEYSYIKIKRILSMLHVHEVSSVRKSMHNFKFYFKFCKKWLSPTE